MPLANLPFASAEAFVFDGNAGNDTLTLAAVAPLLAGFRGGSDFDTLNVNAGTLVLDEDAALTTDNLTLNLAGGTVVANASQRLDGLDIATGQFSMSPSGNRVLRTRSLFLAPGARLDLSDNDLIVD